MIWSPSRNFCFVHVPKTGGTAIAQAYRPHLRFGDVVLGAWNVGLDDWYEKQLHLGKHCHASAIAAHMGDERFRQALSFAILRDPLDRMVSYYRWIHSHQHPGKIEQELKAHQNFEAFVEESREHLGPQADLVCDTEKGMPMVSVLAPYPHLAEAWLLICRRLGIDAPLKVANASRAARVHVSDRAREMVSRYYARDVELYREASARWSAERHAPSTKAAS